MQDCNKFGESGSQQVAGDFTSRSDGAAKRNFDAFLSALGLAVLSPLFLLIAALIKLFDRGPVFYRQSRIGLHGKPFRICKFRTMVVEPQAEGPLVTRDGDSRITTLGRILRRTKLDELPQLWNVLKGEMSLVGPRPEVSKYVKRYAAEQRAILNLKPGITDLASIHFRNEEKLLKNAQDVEEFYVRHCIPRKVQLNLDYASKANLCTDTWIILQTVCPYWICLLLSYTAVLAGSFWFSCLLIYNFSMPAIAIPDFSGAMTAFVAVQLGALIWRKQCRGLLSYFSLPELKQLTVALGLACLVLLSLWTATNPSWPPLGLIIVDSLVAFCSLSGWRLLLRCWRDSATADETVIENPPLRVGIVGAGYAGSQLACEMMRRKRFGRSVVAFFDDDVQKWNKLLHNVPVIGMPECLLEGWARRLDEVIIAMPDGPLDRVREIGCLLEKAGLRARIAPPAHSLRPWSESQLVGGSKL